jgi:hypothetical protein
MNNPERIIVVFFTEHISRKIIQPQAEETNIIQYNRVTVWIFPVSSKTVMFSILISLYVAFQYKSLCLVHTQSIRFLIAAIVNFQNLKHTKDNHFSWNNIMMQKLKVHMI